MAVAKNELHAVLNSNCPTCKNRLERKTRQDDTGYCIDTKSTIDGNPIRCVGGWGKNKVLYIKRYVAITGVGLKSYPEMCPNYIEVCSGPGRCIDYSNAQEFDGTALAVLRTEGARHFNKLFFFDIDDTTVEILRTRIQSSNEISEEVKNKTFVLKGDYKQPQSIINVVSCFTQPRTLNVMLVDPTDMSIPGEFFTSILEWHRRTDFIINFADGTDLRRNIIQAMTNPHYVKLKEKYATVIPDWDNFVSSIENKETISLDQICALYKEWFTGYFHQYRLKYNDEVKVRNYYKLLYFTGHERGLDFWKKATRKTINDVESGQGFLF